MDKTVGKSAISPPKLEDLAEISRDLGLECTTRDLSGFKDHIGLTLEGYERLERMVSPTLDVKYPRKTGHRPSDSDNKHNAWCWKSEITGAAAGILKGKRLAIKDNVCIAGLPMTNGSAMFDGYVPEVDATIVTRILDAGGIITGKTNCEHLCFSGSSMTCDLGPVLNPADKTRTSGGSSSGSAVVVALGEVDMAIGTDQGGSIRIPSSWCGLVGLKPTFGLVPYTGVAQIETTCDHIGPIARNVADCALLLEAIAGYDGGRDSRQPRDLNIPKYSQMLQSDLTGRKIGLLSEGLTPCDSDVLECMTAVVQLFKSDGIRVKEMSVPIHSDALTIWGPVCTEGGYSCMVEGAGAGYLNKGYYVESLADRMRLGFKTKAKDLSETMKLVCLSSEYLKRRYGNRYYVKARNMCMTLTESYNNALQEYDVIIMPTLPYTAPKLPSPTSTLQERLAHCLGMVTNTAPFDVTGHPAITVNMGHIGGLPVGMMIVGKHFDETKVLQYAYRFEQLLAKSMQ